MRGCPAGGNHAKRDCGHDRSRLFPTACVLKVLAVSQTDVVVKPERVAFGTVARGRESVQSVDVEYNGTRSWRIKEVLVAQELPLEATLSAPVNRPGKVCYRLTVALKGDARPGRVRDYIYLGTNEIDVPPVPVLVTATVQAEEEGADTRLRVGGKGERG